MDGDGEIRPKHFTGRTLPRVFREGRTPTNRLTSAKPNPAISAEGASGASTMTRVGKTLCLLPPSGGRRRRTGWRITSWLPDETERVRMRLPVRSW